MQPQAAQSAPHTSIGKPPQAALLTLSFFFQDNLCKDGEEIIRRNGIARSADRRGNIEFAVIDRHININRGTCNTCPERTRVNVHIEYQLHMVDVGRRLIDPNVQRRIDQLGIVHQGVSPLLLQS